MDRYGIPYVFIHGTYEQLGQKPCVLLDDAGGMANLVRHLIKTGHHTIAGIFKADDIQGINRHKGYATALSEHGLVYDPEHVIWYHTDDRNVKPLAALEKLLESGEKIDAVVCYNDEIAYKTVELLMQLGRKVPGDISVTGFDDSYLAEACPVKLTTAGHPKQQLGREAAQLVLELISGNISGPQVRIIRPELELRNSTADKA